MTIAGVAGMGGVGKTTLAVRVAHRVADSYPDGQLYVNLRGADAAPLDPAEVLARFLRALNVDSRAVPPDEAERAEVYRGRLANRRVLVVLDNAVSEEQVRPLLPGSGTCAVLITSRTRLSGLAGVAWTDLDVFDEREAIRLLARVGGARTVARQPVHAERIVRLCGRLPLAVRVAAARLAARPAWDLAYLVRLLEDERRRLDRLATGDLAVRACLELSYDELDDRSRRLLRLLSLFDVPDFPAWLAAVVLETTADLATEHIEALVDAQLLCISGSDAAGQHRYRFHDLVRLYARERAETEDADRCASTVARGLGAWLAIAEQMAARVPGPCWAAISGAAPRPEIDWAAHQLGVIDPMDWFDAERAALLAAIDQACRLGLDEYAFDLAERMEKYFDVRGMYADWGSANFKAMAVCRARGNLRGEAVMLRGLVDLTMWITIDQCDAALAGFEPDPFRLFAMFASLKDPRGMSDAAVMCSWVLIACGEYPEAITYATRALRLADSGGHPGGRARAHVALAIVLRETRQLAAAIRHLMKALRQARALGNPRYEATVLQFLGIAHRESGNLDESHRRLEQSLAISRRHRDSYTEVLTLLGLARLHLDRGEWETAREIARSSLELGRRYHMNHHVADALTALGEIELAANRHRPAIAHLTEAVSIWRTRGWLSFRASALASLARAHLADHDRESAAGPLTEAGTIFAKLGDSAKVRDLAELAQRMSLPSSRGGG